MINNPSIDTLLQHIDSRYELVIAISRRARQLAGDSTAAGSTESAVSRVAAEVAEGKVRIVK